MKKKKDEFRFFNNKDDNNYKDKKTLKRWYKFWIKNKHFINDESGSIVIYGRKEFIIDLIKPLLNMLPKKKHYISLRVDKNKNIIKYSFKTDK